MKPITREEQYLNKLTGEEQSIAEPITREEQYLSRLCGADNIIPQTPETRRETYLAALCGEEVETPEPVTRIEQYMNFAAGKSQSKPEKAITREEMYWDKYQGGAVPEEKTVQGDIIHITDATGDNAVALSVALTPTQDGTPWISDTLNTEPYLSRAAQNGNTADETIVGGTVAWNQLVDSNTTEVPTISGRKYLTVISGTKSIIAGNGTSISVTGGTDNVHDLTQMFGSTIADYVYALETATAGAGVAWLRSHGFIDDNYHAYNPGELISAKPTAKVVGDTTYTLGGADLRGLFKLDANNNLYCDGDVYTADGTITRKYGIVDLGTLNWSYSTSRTYPYFTVSNSSLFYNGQQCFTLYVDVGRMSGADFGEISTDKCFSHGTGGNSSYIKIRDNSYTDAESFKTAMTGKYLIYELATPTTEQSTAYTNPQKAGEAESFVDARTEKVPVGHSTRYSAEYDINGWTEASVNTTEDSYADTVENGFIDSDGNEIANTSSHRTEFIAVEKGDIVKFGWKNNASGYRYGRLAYYDTSRSFINLGYNSTTKAKSTSSITRTIPDGVAYIRFAADYGTINYGYKNHKAIKIQFGRTVYGGTIDVVSGEMTITWAIADMGDLEWTQPSTGYFEAYFNAYNTGHEIFGLLTTSYPRDDGTNMIYYARITARGTNQRGIVVRDSRYNDVTVFKTAVTGQKVAYELSTPITATIDPTTIALNEGENYVWTEEGTTTLTYMAKAAQRVLAMNRTLQKNLNAIELKKGGDLK